MTWLPSVRFRHAGRRLERGEGRDCALHAGVAVERHAVRVRDAAAWRRRRGLRLVIGRARRRRRPRARARPVARSGVHRLVGRDLHADEASHGGKAGDVPGGDRLLDPVDAVRLEPADRVDRRRHVPRLVRVDTQQRLWPDRLADGGDDLLVVAALAADLDVDDAVPSAASDPASAASSAAVSPCGKAIRSTSSRTRPPRNVEAGTPSALPRASQHATSMPASTCIDQCGVKRQRPSRQSSPRIASTSPGERPTNASAISRPYAITAEGSSQIDSPYPVTPSSVSTVKSTRLAPRWEPERQWNGRTSGIASGVGVTLVTITRGSRGPRRR